MADNSNGGQYQTSDPSQTTDGNVSITGSNVPPPPNTPDTTQQSAPLPTTNPAQPADPSSPTQNPQSSQSPQGPQGQQSANQKPPQQPQQPQQPSRTARLIANAREISDELVGGDPYKTQIDPKTGETTRVRQPLSPRAIGLSLVLEALKGGLSGAGEHGPGAVGQAAQAGLKQGEQIAQQRQDQQQQQDQQAQTDLKTRQQVTINNLQTRQLAQTLGRQSLEEAQKSVDADSAEWQAHQQDQSSILAQGLSHDDAYAMMAKQPTGAAQVVITGARPRVDPKTGQPVYQLPNGQVVDPDTPGSYQAPDFTYAIVKPTAKHSLTDNDGNLTPEVKDNIKYGYQQIPTGADGKFPANYQVDGTAYQAGTRGTQIAKALQSDVDKSRQAVGLDPIDISKDTAQDSNVRQGLMVYNGVLGDSNGDHQKAYQAVLNSKYASAAGTIQNWYGGKDAVRHLDNMRESQNFDSDVLSGDKPVATRDDAQRAIASHNPKVVAAGKAAFARMDKEDADQASKRAFATESAHVWGETKLKEAADRLAKQGGANNPYFNEPVNPQTGMKDNYLNSIQDGELVKNVIRGTANVNLRTKAGMALANEAAIATGGRFDATKYEGYQKLRSSIVGKQGDSFASGSTALDHLDSMVQAANRVSVSPVLGGAARKGFLGKGYQDEAKNFEAAQHTAASELGKAVEGKLLTESENKDWQARINAWTPEEAKSGGKALADLLYERMQEKSDQLKQLAPAGIVTGLHGMSKRGVDSYNRITGKGITYESQALNNDSPDNTQNANPISRPAPPPQGAAGTMKFSDGNTYYVDANKKPLARTQ